MSMEPPAGDELRALAREHGFELSDDEVDLYRGLMEGSLGAFDALEAAPSGLPPAPQGRKWWEPSPEENPLGAWYVCCEIRTATRARSPACASRRRTT